MQTKQKHGTVSRYNNLKCRCPRCKAAARDDSKLRKARRAADPTPERVHGTYNGYTNYGCRCDRCKKAAADTRKGDS